MVPTEPDHLHLQDPNIMQRGRIKRELEDGVTVDNQEISFLVMDKDVDKKDGHVEKTLELKVIKPKQSPQPQNRILFLNGVRGLAALLVMMQHAGFYPDLNLGAPAVDVFFVLSAFLLTMLFEKKCRQMLKEPMSLRKWVCMLVDYFSKRFFRVYPLFAATAIVVSMLSKDDKTKYFKVKNPDEFDLFKVLTFDFSSRYHVFWTLPVEIGYYFLIPVFVAVFICLRQRWWIPVIPMWIWIVHEGLYVFRTSHFPLAPHLPTFFSGSLAAIIYAKLDALIKQHSFEFRKWHILLIRAVEYCVIGLVLSICFRGLFFNWIHENPIPAAPGFPFVSLPVTIIMVIEMILPSAIARVFEWNVLCYAGKVSFSMYLLHSFVIYNDTILAQHKYDRYFAEFTLTFLLATASYWLIEYPSQLMAGRISKKLNQWR